MSGRFSGSPPVRTNTGTPMAATWSISRSPSSVESSKGWRRGSAMARQWTHAWSQACVTSQITMKGFSFRFTDAPLGGKRSYSTLADRPLTRSDRRHMEVLAPAHTFIVRERPQRLARLSKRLARAGLKAHTGLSAARFALLALASRGEKEDTARGHRPTHEPALPRLWSR